jgi:beta-aspartyl-peptidase (threonine type)
MIPPNAAECPPAIIVHGGAWSIPERLTERSLAGVRRAAAAGYAVLTAGGSAVDAVEAAVLVLEDDPVFDAGRGSCLNAKGAVEMDAVIMVEDPHVPHSLRAGAVAAVSVVRNPVVLARKVMETTDHCLLVGPNADEFAAKMNATDDRVQLVNSVSDLVTPDAVAEWEAYNRYSTVVSSLFNRDSVQVDHSGHDTVGAVAMDVRGQLAAATSTGGITNKMPGRVGDSPIIGSGAYVTCDAGAASTTGHGESIMKTVLARHALALMESGPVSAPKAAEQSLDYMHRKTGGCGGIILVDKKGRTAYSFTTERMAWASIEAADGGLVRSGIDA